MSKRSTGKEKIGKNNPCRHKDISICERSDGKLINVCMNCNYERFLNNKEEDYWRDFVKGEQYVFLKYPLQK